MPSSVIVYLYEDTTNTLSDPKQYSYQDDADIESPIYSKVDLTIIWEKNSSLDIVAKNNDAVEIYGALTLSWVQLNIDSVDDGIVWYSEIIENSSLSINSEGDAIKADTFTSSEDEDSYVLTGSIVSNNSYIDIITDTDWLSSDSHIIINWWSYDITAWSGFSSSDDTSRKWIKTETSLYIYDGDITINSLDNTLHSNGSITIDSGAIILSTSDDAIHAETDLTINDGSITIANSYEWIEALNIVINSWYINLTSSDDGFNISAWSTADDDTIESTQWANFDRQMMMWSWDMIQRWWNISGTVDWTSWPINWNIGSWDTTPPDRWWDMWSWWQMPQWMMMWWDQNMVWWWFWSGGMIWGGGMWWFGWWGNILRERILEVDEFVDRYNQIYTEVHDTIHADNNGIIEVAQQLADVFLSWNEDKQIIETQTYENSFTYIIEKINQQSADPTH